MVPNGQHLANARQGAAAAGLRPADVLYLCLPLHHNMAQGYGILPALLAGCTVRLAPKFNRSRFWAEVRGCGATVWPFVGGLLALLDDLPPRDDDADNPLRVAYGVPIPARLHESFQDRFGIGLVHGYGSTEATIPVWSDEGCPVGAAGAVLADYQVRVLDQDDREVPAGTVGQICVRPKRPFTMFAGYAHDADKTVTACRNLWFHTGDLGSFDASGYLWFRGRIGDAIRRFGEFVDAEEVEAAALEHDAVLQAACVGVPDAVARPGGPPVDHPPAPGRCVAHRGPAVAGAAPAPLRSPALHLHRRGCAADAHREGRAVQDPRARRPRHGL